MTGTAGGEESTQSKEYTLMKRSLKSIYIAAVMLLALMAGPAAPVWSSQDGEQDGDTAQWQYHDIVDAAFVKVHTAMPMPDGVMLIDARPYKPKYVNGHIPGAVNIPFTQFDKKVDLLPEDKNTLLIYYCGGLTCKLSHKSARKAEALGYTNVKVFAKGFPEWKKTPGTYVSVSVDYVAAALVKNEAVIVDARPKKAKFDKGHIPSAMSLPYTYFEDLKGKLPRDPATPLIFYCGGLACKLSHKSANAALDMGYTDVKVFSTGYPEWKKTFGASGAVTVKAGEVEGSMDIEMFKDLLANKPDAMMVVDVRDKDEFDKGSFNGAVHISVEDLEDKIKDLPTDKPVVYICSTGARSGEAYYMTQDVRPEMKNAYYLEAACTFNKDGSYDIKKTEG